MRLIDADVMDRATAEHGVKTVNGKKYVLCDDVRKAIHDCPTAYDVDKVVERIQKIKLPLASQMARIVHIVKEGGIHE